MIVLYVGGLLLAQMLQPFKLIKFRFCLGNNDTNVKFLVITTTFKIMISQQLPGHQNAVVLLAHGNRGCCLGHQLAGLWKNIIGLHSHMVMLVAWQ